MSNFRKTDFWWQWRQTQQRLSEWLELHLKQSAKPTTRAPNLEFLQWLAPYLTWGVGILLVGLLLFILVRGFSSWRTQRLRRQLHHSNRSIPEPPVSMNEWLKRAQQYRRQGNFTQAARSLYFAVIQNLHDRQIIPEQRSRTDQEYVVMTRQLSEPDAFATLIQAHERIQFAGDELSAADYERCQRAYGVANQVMTDANITKQKHNRHRSHAREGQ